MKKAVLIATLVAAAGLSACQSRSPDIVASTKSPVELRAMQARVYDEGDRTRVMRAVIATFQDLGYSVEKVEVPVGTVSASKGWQLQMSVAVVPKGTTQTVVRSNAIVSAAGVRSQVDEPRFYQQLFFEPLSKTLMLSAHDDDDGGAASAPQALNQ